MFSLPEDRPAIMGILNVTPDSFSDGGMFFDHELAIAHAHKMMADGADLIDVGGESTRPGSRPVSADEELKRVAPIVEHLAAQGIPVSIDTSKPVVAQACLERGAQVVNDVTGLRDPAMIEVCAGSNCSVCIMHMQGVPRNMQAHPVYGDVVRDVREYLVHAATVAEGEGIARERIWIDPGIGFGKTVEHNLEIIRRLEELAATRYPVLIGVSRKSFVGKILGSESNPAPPEERLEGSLVMQAIAQMKGARILRVHDVGPAIRTAVTVQSLRKLREP